MLSVTADHRDAWFDRLIIQTVEKLLFPAVFDRHHFFASTTITGTLGVVQFTVSGIFTAGTKDNLILQFRRTEFSPGINVIAGNAFVNRILDDTSTDVIIIGTVRLHRK